MATVMEPNSDDYKAYVQDMADMPADEPTSEDLDDMEREMKEHEAARAERLSYLSSKELFDKMSDTYGTYMQPFPGIEGPLTQFVRDGGYGEVGGPVWGVEEQLLMGAYMSEYVRMDDGLKSINDFISATEALNANRQEGSYIPLVDRGTLVLYAPRLFASGREYGLTSDFDMKTINPMYDSRYLSPERFAGRGDRKAMRADAAPPDLSSGDAYSVDLHTGTYSSGLLPETATAYALDKNMSQAQFVTSGYLSRCEAEVRNLINHGDYEAAFGHLNTAEHGMGVPSPECVQYDVPVRYDLLSKKAMEHIRQLGYGDFRNKDICSTYAMLDGREAREDLAAGYIKEIKARSDYKEAFSAAHGLRDAFNKSYNMTRMEKKDLYACFHAVDVLEGRGANLDDSNIDWKTEVENAKREMDGKMFDSYDKTYDAIGYAQRIWTKGVRSGEYSGNPDLLTHLTDLRSELSGQQDDDRKVDVSGLEPVDEDRGADDDLVF